MTRRRGSRGRRSESGSALIEFVLVVPIALAVLFGLIGACYLFFQNSALHNGASAGARAASIETSLATPTGGKYCESGQPAPIEQTVAKAAIDLPINTATLCASTQTATQLTQSPTVAGKVNITVTCGGNCSAPLSASVTLTYTAAGFTAPMGLSYSMSATSQVPELNP